MALKNRPKYTVARGRPRKNGSDAAGDSTRLTGRQKRELTKMVLYCVARLGKDDGKGAGYRALEGLIPDRTWGWLNHVGKGCTGGIVPTMRDFRNAKHVYDTMKKFEGKSRRILARVVDIMRVVADLQQVVYALANEASKMAGEENE